MVHQHLNVSVSTGHFTAEYDCVYACVAATCGVSSCGLHRASSGRWQAQGLLAPARSEGSEVNGAEQRTVQMHVRFLRGVWKIVRPEHGLFHGPLRPSTCLSMLIWRLLRPQCSALQLNDGCQRRAARAERPQYSPCCAASHQLLNDNTGAATTRSQRDLLLVDIHDHKLKDGRAAERVAPLRT